MSDKLVKKMIVILLTVILTVNSAVLAFADTIYIGGSESAGSGVSGNWSVVIPANNKYLALKVSIEKRKKGDFAENGYTNSYVNALCYISTCKWL